jgi:hypothetical protein
MSHTPGKGTGFRIARTTLSGISFYTLVAHMGSHNLDSTVVSVMALADAWGVVSLVERE